MKKRKFYSLLLTILLLFPLTVFAEPRECSSYDANSCPANNCIVEDGQCVKGHIGQSFCTQKEVMDGLRVAGYFLFLARLAIPFIIIIYGTFDLYKAVTGGDSKSLTASAKKLLFRILIGFSIFLVPSLIHMILSTLNDYNAITDDANVCQTCLLKPSKCENGKPADTNPFDDNIFVTTEPTEPTTSTTQTTEEAIVVN